MKAATELTTMRLNQPTLALIGAAAAPIVGVSLFLFAGCSDSHLGRPFHPSFVFIIGTFIIGALLSGYALSQKYGIIPALLLLATNFYLLYFAYVISTAPG